MQKSIDEASASELAEFARAHHGIEIDGRAGKAKIIAQLQTVGYTSTTIEVPDRSPQELAPVEPAAGRDPEGRVRILIPEQDGPGGTEPVPVGVNGRVDLIKRGEVVAVRKSVVEVLQNAKKVVFSKGPNGEPINPRFVPVHPYSVIGDA